ncbi:MAG: thiamine monophosphate synthase [Sulfuricurvum sp. PC08-66]|nr:MAG: thiamine monophosphate synthase [Sulfuricurvum sp. PC08-66]
MILYALCDAQMLQKRGVTLEAFVAIAAQKGAQIIQYRDKVGDDASVSQALQKLRLLWDKTLLINDRIALASLCDGVHIGQEDLAALHSDPKTAIAQLRQTYQPKMIGLSTHNSREISIANGLAIDYIGLGAYRDTSTKADAKVLGDALDTLASQSRHPVAAIGGVRLEDRFAHVTYWVIGSNLL